MKAWINLQQPCWWSCRRNQIQQCYWNSYCSPRICHRFAPRECLTRYPLELQCFYMMHLIQLVQARKNWSGNWKTWKQAVPQIKFPGNQSWSCHRLRSLPQDVLSMSFHSISKCWEALWFCLIFIKLGWNKCRLDEVSFYWGWSCRTRRFRSVFVACPFANRCRLCWACKHAKAKPIAFFPKMATFQSIARYARCWKRSVPESSCNFGIRAANPRQWQRCRDAKPATVR